MRFTLRASLAAACAAGLVAAPAALPLDTVIRVEGSSANLVPESAIPIEGDGTATVFDSGFRSVDVSRASAFWQLYRATSSTGLGLSFTYFPDFGSVLVDKVGADANAGTAGWQFRVNHVGPERRRGRHGPEAGRPGALVLRRRRRGPRARRDAVVGPRLHRHARSP